MNVWTTNVKSADPRRRLTRRDNCFLVGKRAQTLEPNQASAAWYHLGSLLEQMGSFDLPKFRHLIRAIRITTIRGKRLDPTHPIRKD